MDKIISRDKRLIAIDLGGTQIRVALCDATGRILAQRRAATPADEGPRVVLAVIVDLSAELARDATDQAIEGACIAAPGPLDPRRGIVFDTPNLQGWKGFPLTATLCEMLGIPAWAHNDASLAALGEATCGAGRGESSGPLVYLTVSTGVGGGVVDDGRMLEGQNGLAAELGHVIIKAGGPGCAVGHSGCLEGLASGTALQRAALARLDDGHGDADAVGSRLSALNSEDITAEAVADAARDGDQLASALIDDAATALGLAIGSFVNVFDPALVVIGGGLGLGAWDLMAGTIRSEAERIVMEPAARSWRLESAALGDDAGLVGAAVHGGRMLARSVV